MATNDPALLVRWTLEMSDDGSSDTQEILSEDEPAAEECEERAEEWLRGGDWGDDGARPSAHWRLYDAEGEEVNSGHAAVEIEPNHEALIRAALSWDTRSRCCGLDPEDHSWSSEGEGGCRENPGVWSHGGTSISAADHCRTCGLRRRNYYTGSQRGPGEHDTVSYKMPDSWCAACQREECCCAEETVTCCVCGEDVPVGGEGVRLLATDHGPDHVCGSCEYDEDA